MAFDTTTGVTKWAYRTEGWVQAPVCLDLDRGRVYAGAWDHKFHAVRLSDGGGLWTYPTETWVGSRACLLNGAVCFTDGQQLVCLAPDTGSEMTTVSLPKATLSGPIRSGGDSLLIWYADGTLEQMQVSVNAGLANVTSLRTLTLSLSRSFVQEGFPHVRDLWLGDRLVLIDDAGRLACVDMGKWSVLWAKGQSAFSSSGPSDVAAFTIGSLIVSYGDGRLAALDLETGQTLWHGILPGITSPALACRDGRILCVGRNDGSVTCYGPMQTNAGVSPLTWELYQ
jgi:outer membrane protein assembly factor BamB